METRQQRRDRERFTTRMAAKEHLCCQCRWFELDIRDGKIRGMSCTYGMGHATMPNYRCSNSKYTKI